MKIRRSRVAWCFLWAAFLFLPLAPSLTAATFPPAASSMPYVALADLAGKVPPVFLTQALDDDGDGEADAGLWELIAGQVGDAIDGALGQRYPVPFSTPPAVVRNAAVIFAAEAVYARRVPPEANPWMGQGNAMRSKLEKIGAGEIPLTPELKRQQPSASIITEPARTVSRRRPC